MKTEVDSRCLGLLEDFLVYVRANPEDLEFFDIFLKFGKSFRMTSASELDEFLSRLRLEDLHESYEYKLSYILDRNFEKRGKVEMQPSDFDLILDIFDVASTVRQSKDSKLIYDFSDAFHGVPFALQEVPDLDRAIYARRYFQPFFSKWTKSFAPEVAKKVLQWGIPSEKIERHGMS